MCEFVKTIDGVQTKGSYEAGLAKARAALDDDFKSQYKAYTLEEQAKEEGIYKLPVKEAKIK